jgi:predicted NAD/FAD-dependent oxidoreductase
MKKQIAIIGAGISGLTLAQNLKDDAEVVVYEKARGVGGRMSTRHADPFYFDHGTQYFTARSPAFQRYIAPMIETGLIAPWEGKVITLKEDRTVADCMWNEPHYVAVSNMNSLCKHLALDLKITLSTEVAPLANKESNSWFLVDKEGNELGAYDWVISTAPPVQTRRLFADYLQADHPLNATPMLGCFTLMIGFHAPWDKPWMAAKVHASPFEWIAVNSSKPGRNKSITSIVANSSHAWAEAHIDDDINETGKFLRREFEYISGIDTSAADHFSCHRWRYALVGEPQDHNPYVDTAQGIASTGDWCSVSRIEDAWQNAVKLANVVRRSL